MLIGSETSKGIGIGVARILDADELAGSVSTGSVDDFFAKHLKPGTVLVSNHLTPYMVAKLADCGVSGFVCETGGMTSHSALVARSIGLPAVYGVPGATDAIKDGDTVIVDGVNGFVYERPEASLIEEFAGRKEQYLRSRKELEKFCSMKTLMADSESAEVFCNVNDIADVMHSLDSGGEGIGLYRTENLFSEFGRAPGEEEQVRAYSRIAQAMDGREVVIRTLDIGGDKGLPYIDMEVESNPFLGYRAVRYSLGNREFFSTQLRAILRASTSGKLSIMIPMITCVDEMREVKALIYELKS
ncbi:MAG: phosphoenolpyruvate--protein phosphotransferase, partial [Lachnospiraceae bacterium]|nr:phosphoenolpyruvate--protein phosphotransferase [Lachnospiraceae bacterium]